MFNMKTTPRKLAILSVLISSALLSETAAAAAGKITFKDENGTNIPGVELATTNGDLDIYSMDATNKKIQASIVDGDGNATNKSFSQAQTKAQIAAGAKKEVDGLFDKDAITKPEDKKVFTQNQTNEKIKTVKEQLNANMKAEVNNTVIKGVETQVKAEVGVQTSKIQGELNTKMSDETEKRILGDKETLKNANDYTDTRFGDLKSYTDQKFNDFDNKIDRTEKRANAGVASVAAMSNIPYSNNTGFSLGLGLGQYRNGSAVALGIQDKLNENVSLRLSTSWNNSGSPVFGAGVGISW
ncbi:YadA-like family protein [Xenorhabdus budapestensis]|nr:YadA-like family protein [Xenorhabdus budapestensis]